MWRDVRRLGVMCVGARRRTPTHRVNLVDGVRAVAFASQSRVLVMRL
jgi:hypothetical protein